MASRYKALMVAAIMALPVVIAQTPQAQPGLTGVIVPPASERSVMFTDRGRTYLVGTQTGKVTIVDGVAPQPQPQPGPVIPPLLTGLSKQVYDSLMAAPVDPSTRRQGAAALAGAIDATLGEIGGLGLNDPQQIVDRFATNAEAAKVNELLRGWSLGTLLAGANITTKEQLLQALEEIKRAMQEIAR